jgi:putative phage-type endonuclease
MMIIHNCEQRSGEWLQLRLGKFTASHFADLMPSLIKPDLDKWSDTAKKVILKVSAERMTGSVQEAFVSKSMQWGMQYEDEARATYAIDTGEDVSQVGFIELDEWIGCSPDGLCGDKGLVEIKCPESATHLSYRIDNKKLIDGYFYQVQGQLWISDRDWCDLASYDPRFIDDDKKLLVVRIERDPTAIKYLQYRIDRAIEQAKQAMQS